jgi:hypothetical protein
MDNTIIPNIHSLDVAWYLHSFIDWDADLGEYVSLNNKQQRKAKEECIITMKMLGGIFDPTVEEVTFLWSVEHDPHIKTKLYDVIKFWKKQYNITN